MCSRFSWDRCDLKRKRGIDPVRGEERRKQAMCRFLFYRHVFVPPPRLRLKSSVYYTVYT